MERPAWMPETDMTAVQIENDVTCICYQLIVRCSDPNAAPEDKALLPSLLDTMLHLLGRK